MNNNETLIKVENLSKYYGNDSSSAIKKAIELHEKGEEKNEIFKETGVTIALKDINLEIKKGETFVIIGLSGSGKSTLLRMFNLLNTPSKGKIYYGGDEISKYNRNELIEYRRNKIAMVFQSFGLMSHRDVISNVSYGLEVKGRSVTEREEKSKEIISMVGLDGLENESINSLSGGMKQRVGIARALANDTEVLLMDEPFSALDPLVKKDMQFELLSIQEKLEKTIIFITHDIDEAFKLGDRIAILKDGELIQLGTPEEISGNPATDYVRDFTEGADKTKIISVRNAMIRPNSLVRLRDNPKHALGIMKKNGVSSAYVVGPRMNFEGILTLDGALDAIREDKEIIDVMVTDVMTTHPDNLLDEIMEMAVETNFPIAVVDDNNVLEGIISKVHVLGSML